MCEAIDLDAVHQQAHLAAELARVARAEHAADEHEPAIGWAVGNERERGARDVLELRVGGHRQLGTLDLVDEAPDRFEHAGGGATVAVDVVAIVALLAAGGGAVAASTADRRRPDADMAGLDGADVGASIARDLVCRLLLEKKKKDSRAGS